MCGLPKEQAGREAIWKRGRREGGKEGRKEGGNRGKGRRIKYWRKEPPVEVAPSVSI